MDGPCDEVVVAWWPGEVVDEPWCELDQGL